jgi:hypothetical protein
MATEVIKFMALDGTLIAEHENTLGVKFALGQAVVVNGTAYQAANVINSPGKMIVELGKQTFCGDCGGSKVSPSNRPRCACK